MLRQPSLHTWLSSLQHDSPKPVSSLQKEQIAAPRPKLSKTLEEALKRIQAALTILRNMSSRLSGTGTGICGYSPNGITR